MAGSHHRRVNLDWSFVVLCYWYAWRKYSLSLSESKEATGMQNYCIIMPYPSEASLIWLESEASLLSVYSKYHRSVILVKYPYLGGSFHNSCSLVLILPVFLCCLEAFDFHCVINDHITTLYILPPVINVWCFGQDNLQNIALTNISFVIHLANNIDSMEVILKTTWPIFFYNKS